MASIAGAGDPGIFWIETRSGSEEEIRDWVSEFRDYEIRYAATREFDEMVLRGRFTNARRAHSPTPGPWPNVDGLDLEWNNIRKTLRTKIARGVDLPSRDVPAAWLGNCRRAVAIHCLRDVAELVLRDPDVHLSRELGKALRRLMF
jgi:hypothetical protein